MRWDRNYKQPEIINDPVVIPAYGVTDVERAYWNGKQDRLEYDPRPIEKSDKSLLSGVVWGALEEYKVQTVQLCQAYFNGQVGGLVQTKNACEAAATRAETAETAAEGYKDSAAESAASAQEAISTTTEAAISAAASKAAAESAATTATTEATAASNSASAAATSATNAAGSETNAASSASAASTSATNAAASATNAASSATDAAASATAAESSKTDAATSATNAATSATNAETSATNAAASATAAADTASTVTAKTEEAEAWAKGTRDGVPVEVGDPAYHNNAKYYADAASAAVDVIDDTITSAHKTWSSDKIDTELDTKASTTALNSKADLVNGKVPSSQLPAFVDDVVEGYYNSITDRFYEESTFETLITPEEGKSWVDIATNKSYRWTGSRYVRVDEGVQLGETSDTAYAGNKGKQNADNISAIQAMIPNDASSSNKFATESDIPSVDNFIEKSNIAGFVKNDGTIDTNQYLTQHQDISGKADKVSNAISGNFAALDASGNLTDSGNKASDFLTQHQDITGKADKVSGATTGNFAALDANGNLVDSGYDADDFSGNSGDDIDPILVKSIVHPLNTYSNVFKKVNFKKQSNSLNIQGRYIWSDGVNTYYSNGATQYVFDESTESWSAKTWYGLTEFLGRNVWTDYNNIYYSSGTTHYVLNKTTSTWSVKTWAVSSFSGINVVAVSKDMIYLFSGTASTIYFLKNHNWIQVTFNGMPSSCAGEYIWTDGIDYYFSASSSNYRVDFQQRRFSSVTFSNLSAFAGNSIWTDGENIYCSSSAALYMLDIQSKYWTQIEIVPITQMIGVDIWHTNNNTYCSVVYNNIGRNYKLNKNTNKWQEIYFNDTTNYPISGDMVWQWASYTMFGQGDSLQFRVYPNDFTIINVNLSGINDGYGKNIWYVYYYDTNNRLQSDIYYSDGNKQYKMGSSVFSSITWSAPLTEFSGEDVWYVGTNTYYNVVGKSYQYFTDFQWNSKTWNGLTDFLGRYVWSDGVNTYYSNGNEQYVLDVDTDTWSVKTWHGLTDFTGNNVWVAANSIYYSDGTIQYELDIETDTWYPKTWEGLTSFYGKYIWLRKYYVPQIFYSDGSGDTYMLIKRPFIRS